MHNKIRTRNVSLLTVQGLVALKYMMGSMRIQQLRIGVNSGLRANDAALDVL